MRWSHGGTELFFSTHPDVYVPSHDSFLLARAVALEVRPGDRFLEVGCGAGPASLVAAGKRAHVVATDRNPHAAALTRHNARENGLAIDAVVTDLMAGLNGPFDVVAFNPPYLPTATEEVIPGLLNLAFDGGRDGNETVLRFAAQVAALTHAPRSILVVHSSLSDPRPLHAALGGLGYVPEPVLEEAHAFERLTVWCYRGPAT
ncbi:MAG: HemK2/MTQ2 family protein methyltransferase [Thermoplasmatota archaeon]